MAKELFDGMMVEFTEDKGMWCADWEFVSNLYRFTSWAYQLPDDLHNKNMFHIENRRARYMGYTAAKYGSFPGIPAGTVAKVRRYRIYWIDVPLEPPTWIMKKMQEDEEEGIRLLKTFHVKEGKTRPVEIVKLYNARPPEDPFKVDDWWGLYIQQWPVEKFHESTERNHRKYIRGLGLAGNNIYNDCLPEWLQ